MGIDGDSSHVHRHRKPAECVTVGISISSWTENEPLPYGGRPKGTTMGLLADLGFDDLANEGRYTGSALSDVIQAAGAPVTSRAKEHARTYVKSYTQHTLIIPQHQPLLSACKVSATPDGAGKAFSATGADVLEF